MSQTKYSLMPFLTRIVGFVMLISIGIALWIAYSSEYKFEWVMMGLLMFVLILIIICQLIDFVWRFYHRPDYLKSPAKFFRREWMKYVISSKKKKRKEHQAQLLKKEERRMHNRSSVMATKKRNRIYHKFMSFDESKKPDCITTSLFVLAFILAGVFLFYISVDVFYDAFKSSNNEISDPIKTKGWAITQETLFNFIFIFAFLIGIILAVLSFIWFPIKKIRKMFEEDNEL